jgi:hypothetical protein
MIARERTAGGPNRPYHDRRSQPRHSRRRRRVAIATVRTRVGLDTSKCFSEPLVDLRRKRESFEYTFAGAGQLLAGCHEPGHYDGGMVADITVEG